jgi:hypothetical protein
MKPILALLFFFTFNSVVFAQEFAPVGAEWHYNARYGIFHAKVEKDTVIKGTACRKISCTSYIDSIWTARGLHVSDKPDIYVYDNADTVFMYNVIFKKFTPLYVFNVNAGDTIQLPIMPPAKGDPINIYDSTLRFVVDSIKSIRYDTTELETVFTHSLATRDNLEYSFGAYARKLGNSSTGLLPWCNGCIFPLTESDQSPFDIRCYRDQSTFVKLVPDDCAKNLPVNVSKLQNNTDIKLYPNPATNVLRILGTANGSLYVIYDVAGRKVKTGTIDGVGEIDIATLKPGVHHIRFMNGNLSKQLTFVKE